MDPEGPSREDLERLNRRPVHCQECGEEIFDYAEVCPYCGAYQIDAERARKQPMWIVILAIVALITFLLWAVL